MQLMILQGHFVFEDLNNHGEVNQYIEITHEKYNVKEIQIEITFKLRLPGSLLLAAKERETRKDYIVDYCKRRKEFIKFVMTCGIKSAIVRAIVSLYEQPTKPDDALEYITCFLGASLPSEDEVKGQLEKLQQMRDRISALDVENQTLREKLEELEIKAATDLLDSETAGEYDGDAEDEEYLEEAEAETNLLEDDLAACIDSDLNFTFFNL
ncbi:unnamed protein product [Allacma fusca]|uniref:Uncharacterized protein n=1 Tax=Allacma fusca TaxID=39272 RepID=A0A8J2JAU0_9HEXA|nr:unnamed protein product [Allacma fusca]